MVASRHLHSALHPFTCLWTGFPWRTFTLSCPLQSRIWLLRRLRPPPPRASIFAPHHWARREWSSPVPIADVLAIRSCPLYTGCAVE